MYILKEDLMKKRVLSLFMALMLCLTLLPTAAFAEGEAVSISGGVIGGGETGGEGGGIYVAPGSPTEGGGGTYIPGEDTRTEIWCVSKPDAIGRSYDGTTNGDTISLGTLGFTDGENSYTLTEGTDFTAKRTFDSADAGDRTVTVEIALIGDAATKYKLKAGKETFTIGGIINKAYPNLTVSLSKPTCTAGEKLLPLLSVSGAPEGAAVTYYYAPLNSGYLEFEGTEIVPEINENTAISEPGTYYVYAKTGETTNYKEERSTTVELTVNEAVVEAASITKADGTDGGTYESLPAALNAAQDGDTVKLLANHVTDADALNALGENFTFEQYASIVPVVTKTLTLDLNHKTVDYLEVGFSETNEETQKKETLATGNLTVTGEAAYGRISNLMFMAGALDIRSGEIGGSGCAGLLCDANSGSVTVSNGTVYGLTVLEGASVTVNGGSKHAGEWVVASGATLNITDGTFGEVQFTRNGTIAISGGTFKSIKSYIAEELQPLMSLLDTQKVHAFYKGDDVQDGNATELTDVTVKEHTHTMVNNTCACGFSCTHTNAEGASTIGEDGKCTACGTQFAAGIGETYYTDVPSALNAAADGQTVKLLANGTLPRGIYVSKTLTLDLNGHSLDRYSLNVGGLTVTGQALTGDLKVVDSSGGNGAVGVTVRDGGTLVFDPENDRTTLLQLEVWGGTVQLYGGRILRKGLQLHNGIVLGGLLPQKAGLAYYCDDTQLTLEEAASKTCDLVVKSCSHGGKNGFDGTNCPYCNAPAVAETALNNGEGGGLWRRFADLQTALDADRDGGAEFKLLADVTGDYTIDGTKDTGLDLQGHSIKGTVTVKAAAGRNTTTLSNTKNTTTASIDAVVAYRGAKLAGSRYPAVIGELTLAEGATWKNILNDTALGYKVLNADGTHKWYARDDVKGSQLNNVIINRLPITTKTLNLKVDGKNLTGNSPKVERGATVQLCASCNTKGADVYIYTGEIVGNNEPTYSQKKAEYKKIGSNWYYVVGLDANTIGTYDIYFTAAKDGYSVTSNHKKLTVTKAAIPASAITAPAANVLTYNGNKQALITAGSVTSGGTMQYSLTENGTYSQGIPTGTDAGTYTVWYRVIGDANHNDTAPASVPVSIGQKPLTITGVTAASKPYDGTTDAGIPSVTFDNVTLKRDTDYTVTANFDDAGVGSGKNVTATVTLMGQAAKNYALEQSSFPTTGSITKAAAPDFTKETALVVVNGHEKTYTVTLPALPTLETPKEYGALTYELGDIKLNAGYYISGAKVENGELTLPIQKNDVETTGSVGTVTVVIKSANYEDITLTVNVSAKNKITPVLAGTLTLTPIKITYGEPLSKIKITGTMKAGETVVEGTFSWQQPGDTILDASTSGHDVGWTFTPKDGNTYTEVTGTVKVPVAPKSIEGAAITLEKYEFQYNAAEQSPRITGVTLEDWSETRITYDIKSGDKATNANDSIPLTIEGTGNYTGTAMVEWKITPKTVTPTIEVEPCTYTGDALEPTVTLKDGDAVIPAGEYTAAYSNNTNAGVGQVTITNNDGGNYVIQGSTQDFTIDKVRAPAAEVGSLTITNGLHKTYSFDLSTLLPKLTAPCNYGTITYDRKVDTNLGVGSFITLVDGKTGELTLDATRSGTDEGQFGTITVTASTSNYQDIILTINVIAKNKLSPVLADTLTLTPIKITYGEPLSKIKITGTMKAGETVVEGTFSWQQPGDTILDASTSGHDVGWTFTPKDGNTYTEVTGTATVQVDKATQYGKVSMAGYTYGQMPSTPTLINRTGDANAQVTYRYSAAGSGSVQTWDIQNPPALNAGTYRMYASIGDTDNYYEFEAVYCEFVVAKATPAYTVPTGLTARYGQALADVTLPDGWSWMDSSESVGGASTAAKTFQAKFTPTDTENYNAVENIELEVMVNKADQAALTITGADSVFYGQTLTLTTTGGSGTGTVTYRIDAAHSTGEATIDPETGVLTPVKVGSVSVIATKAGDNDYNDVTSAPFVLMIKPATPTGEPNYTKITTSGKTLKDAALTTKGSTLNPSDGKLEWVDDKGNVLPDSTRIEANTTYRWRFTPTGANYATLTGKIELYHESSSGGGGWYDSYYTIEATAGAGGSISPSGNISVREGADQTFTITPDKGYAVANVKIDGESIGAVKSYTFENVSKAHAIEVIFVKGTASASTGDSSNLLLWSALLLASTLTLAGAVHYKRKRAR